MLRQLVRITRRFLGLFDKITVEVWVRNRLLLAILAQFAQDALLLALWSTPFGFGDMILSTDLLEISEFLSVQLAITLISICFSREFGRVLLSCGRLYGAFFFAAKSSDWTLADRVKHLEADSWAHQSLRAGRRDQTL